MGPPPDLLDLLYLFFAIVTCEFLHSDEMGEEAGAKVLGRRRRSKYTLLVLSENYKGYKVCNIENPIHYMFQERFRNRPRKLIA